MIDFYGNSLDFSNHTSVLSHLNHLAKKMLEDLDQKVDCLYTEINNYNSHFIGWTPSDLSNRSWNLNECKFTIAREYGYQDWSEIEMMDDLEYDSNFELAVKYLLNGNIDELSRKLDSNPNLTLQKSPYGHQATLLHYTASNGVEMWRQQVPYNLGEIVRLLIAKGADQSAKMNVYSGSFTSKELFTTSAHPYKVGIGEKVASLFN